MLAEWHVHVYDCINRIPFSQHIMNYHIIISLCIFKSLHAYIVCTHKIDKPTMISVQNPYALSTITHLVSGEALDWLALHLKFGSVYI